MPYCKQCNYNLQGLEAQSVCPECGSSYDIRCNKGVLYRKKCGTKKIVMTILLAYVISSYITSIFLAIYSEIYIYNTTWGWNELRLFISMNAFRVLFAPFWMAFYVIASSAAYLTGWNNTTMQYDHFGTDRPLVVFLLSFLSIVLFQKLIRRSRARDGRRARTCSRVDSKKSNDHE